MRERVTFVHAPEDSFDPSQLRIENGTLHISSLKAAREDRVTFGFHELPQELWRALKQCHEFHLRWVSSKPYETVAPFVSRISPGLHVFYTPQRNRPADLICPLLRKIFGETLKCTTPDETFTGIPKISERFTSSAAFQYYQLLPTLADLVTYIQQKACAHAGDACFARVEGLNSADYLDVDFDTISQTLTLGAFRHEAPSLGFWNEQISNDGSMARTEVGILANERPTEPEELSLGGFLTIIGEDDKPSPTLFSFPSRHHPVSQSEKSKYFASFLYPTGLHPTLRLTFPSSSMTPPSETCALHAYLTLPSTIFPDKYQLSAPLFLASKNLHSVRSISGETDLEAPDWAITKWGSAMLIELAPPSKDSLTMEKPWHAEIPLHLRYLRPSQSGTAGANFPWPAVFWACTADEGSKMNVNPFDRVNLGYDGLFGPRTMFYHLNPSKSFGNGNDSLVMKLDVPVLPVGQSTWIESGTMMVIALGLVWILAKLVPAVVHDSKQVLFRSLDEKKAQ